MVLADQALPPAVLEDVLREWRARYRDAPLKRGFDNLPHAFKSVFAALVSFVCFRVCLVPSNCVIEQMWSAGAAFVMLLRPTISYCSWDDVPGLPAKAQSPQVPTDAASVLHPERHIESAWC